MPPINPYQKTTYLLGAGFSKAVDPDMPLMKELAVELRKRTQSSFANDLLRLTDLNLEAWLFSLLPKNNISKGNRHSQAFDDACKCIGALIRNASSWCGLNTTSSDGRRDTINSLVRYCEKYRFDILSFNYDTLIEQHWRKLDNRPPNRDPSNLYPVKMNQGQEATKFLQTKPGFRLFKLHGSVDWSVSEDSIIYHDDYALKSGEITPDNVPYIVPPVSDKNEFLNCSEIKKLWQLAKKRIMSTKLLVVMGYSFPPSDTDVEELLSEYSGNVLILDQKPCAVEKRICSICPQVSKIQIHRDRRKNIQPEDLNPVEDYCEILECHLKN